MSNLAAVMPELGRIEVQEVPLREPGPREVRVRVRAVGVCGSDTAYYRIGRIGDWIVDGPIILGHEAAGEVIEGPLAGKRVTMNPLVIWLASARSDGTTGCRFVGKLWDPALDPDAAAERAREEPVFHGQE